MATRLAPITLSPGGLDIKEPDAVPMRPSPDHNDNMILDWLNNMSPSGFGHPSCKGGAQSSLIIRDLSKEFPTRRE